MKDIYKFLKIGLAFLLFLCVLDMPYGFYQIVRFVALLVFALLAYKSYEKEDIVIMIIYISLALLFQPIFKVSLGRLMWNIVDIIVGIALVVSVFANKFRNNPE